MSRIGDRFQDLVSIASNWATLAINVAVGLLLTPFVLEYVGKSGYGIWTLLLSFVGYYGLLNVGTNAALIRYIAVYSGKKDRAALEEISSSAMALFCLIALVTLLLSFVLAPWLPGFFELTSEQARDFEQLLWIIGGIAGIRFLGNVPGSILQAQGRFVAYNVIGLAATLARAIFTVLFLVLGGGLVGIGAANLLSALINTAGSFAVCRKGAFPLRLRRAKVRLSWIRALTGFGFFVFLTYLGDMLRFQLDSVVIGKFLDMERVGIYGICVLLFRYLLNVCNAVARVYNPKLSALYGAGEGERFRRDFISCSAAMGLFALYVGVGAGLLGKPFIRAWVGPGFDEAGPALVILLCGIIPDLATSVSMGALRTVKKHQFVAWQTLAEGAANLALSLILVKPFGIAGVAMGTTIPIVITKVIVQPLYCAKVLEIPYGPYLRRCLLAPFAAAGLAGLPFALCVDLDAASTFPRLIFLGILISAAYLPAAFFLGLEKAQRAALLGRLGRILRSKRIRSGTGS